MILKKLYPSRCALIFFQPRKVEKVKINESDLGYCLPYIFVSRERHGRKGPVTLSFSVELLLYDTAQSIVSGPFFRAFFSSLQMIHF